MFLDSQLLFSDAQAITAAATSTNTLDLGAVRDIGTGQNLFVVVTVDIAFTDTGSDSTLTVTLWGDSTTTLTPDATQDLFVIPALTAAGATFIASLDPGAAPLQLQYIALRYTPNNGNLSTGTITAFVTKDVQRVRAYPDAITITGIGA